MGGSSAECRSETQCSSFTQREDNYSNVVSRHTEATPETRVSCDACGCTYNQDKRGHQRRQRLLLRRDPVQHL